VNNLKFARLNEADKFESHTLAVAQQSSKAQGSSAEQSLSFNKVVVDTYNNLQFLPRPFANMMLY
jgi:hypothetical protein